MLGYTPHPSLVGGGSGGSTGPAVDQAARDAAAAAAAVNASQETEISGLKTVDAGFETRVAAGETIDTAQNVTLTDHGTRIASGEAKDVVQDSVIGGHGTRIAAGESKDAAQDLVLTDHGTRIGTVETKDASQDVTLADHTTRIGAGETKDTAQDATLADHGTRIGQNETKNTAQDTLLSQHTTKLSTNDTKDASQDTRLTNIENNLATGGLSKLSAVRIKTSQTGWGVAANAPAKATHYEIVAIGGGASGVSTGTAASMANVYPKGGFPGAKRFSARRPINGETLDIVIGAGGASVNAAPNASTTAFLQSGGNDTTVAVRKAGNLLARVAAAGGLLYSVAFTPNLRPETAAFLMAAPVPPIPGVGISGDTRGGKPCDAQNGFDMPTGGGGANSTAAYVGAAGKGGDVVYTAGHALHSLERASGGLGGEYISNSGTLFKPGAAGVNPNPDTAETYGPGGGGAGIGNDSGTNTGAAGGNGGFPGGGGGGAWKCPSGAGADGCVDIIYYGLAG